MEGIKAKDQTDFSKMTDKEVFWYLEGKKQGRKDQLADQEEERKEEERVSNLRKKYEEMEEEEEYEDLDDDDQTDILNTDASLGGQYWRGQL